MKLDVMVTLSQRDRKQFEGLTNAMSHLLALAPDCPAYGSQKFPVTPERVPISLHWVFNSNPVPLTKVGEAIGLLTQYSDLLWEEIARPIDPDTIAEYQALEEAGDVRANTHVMRQLQCAREICQETRQWVLDTLPLLERIFVGMETHQPLLDQISDTEED